MSIISYGFRQRVERIWKIAEVDFKKKYSNDILGLFWAVLNPIFRMSVYYFVLSMIMKIREENFAFFIFSGLIIWITFAETSRTGMKVLRSKHYLISTIQFDKFDLYISNAITVFLNFLFYVFVYVVAALIYGIPFTWTVIYVPLIIIEVFILSIGVSFILSIINLYLKDIQHLWSMILLFGFWTSGVFARGELFIAAFPPLQWIQPFIGIIENFRKVMLHGESVNMGMLLYTYLYSIIVFMVGYILFRKYSHLALEKI